jgi:hypothetical protein
MRICAGCGCGSTVCRYRTASRVIQATSLRFARSRTPRRETRAAKAGKPSYPRRRLRVPGRIAERIRLRASSRCVASPRRSRDPETPSPSSRTPTMTSSVSPGRSDRSAARTETSARGASSDGPEARAAPAGNTAADRSATTTNRVFKLFVLAFRNVEHKASGAGFGDESGPG